MLDLRKVIAAFEEVLTNKGETSIPVCADTLIDEIGFDSLDFAEVLIVLEEQLDSEIELDRRIEGATIGDFHRMLTIASTQIS